MGYVERRGEYYRWMAVEMLRQGYTIDQAASVTGYGRNYVRQLGAKNGIRFPRGKYGEHGEHKYDRTEIVRLFKDGKKPKEIAELLGVKSVASVYTALHQVGIWHQKKGKIVYAEEMRFCKECNTAFLCDPRSKKVFCTTKCNKAYFHKHSDIIRRTRRRDAIVDNDITLKKVCDRDGGICYLCGEPIDWDDYQLINGKRFAKGKYPSIDHMIPLSRGGQHSWANVKLAHFSCNASKGVNMVG